MTLEIHKSVHDFLVFSDNYFQLLNLKSNLLISKLSSNSLPLSQVCSQISIQPSQSGIVVVLGNEDTGVSSNWDEADRFTRMTKLDFCIPQRGFAQSLNLSSACAVTSSMLNSARLRDPSLSNAFRMERKRVLLK